MSAELLSRAASMIRERARAATPGPWLADVLGSAGYVVREVDGKPRGGSRIPRPVRVARCGYEDWDTDRGNAEHMASWPPAVAIAVSMVLDEVAYQIAENDLPESDPVASEAIEVARLYLGESS